VCTTAGHGGVLLQFIVCARVDRPCAKLARSWHIKRVHCTLPRAQVLVVEQKRQWYHFLTTTCAIIGGVFTVCGILDGVSYSTVRMMKKVELGKQG
jgi:Endoplasmic reticulum vesicle transporter